MSGSGLLTYYLKSICQRHQENLKVVHINAQSLNDHSHFIEFQQIFSNSVADVVVVSETFFKDSSQPNINNYNVFCCNRRNRVGGGIAVYVSKRYQVRVLEKSRGEEKKPEFILLEIDCKTYKILLGAVYRPPKTGCMDEFVNAMSTLDVIASNIDDLVIEYDQIPAPGFSNHDLIYAVFNLRVEKPKKQSFSFRDYSKINKELLAADAEQVPWHEIYSMNCIDDKVTHFNFLLTGLMDKHAPIRTAYVKDFSQPWFTPDLIGLISRRNDTRVKFLISKCREDYDLWRNIKSFSTSKSKQEPVKPSNFTADELNEHYLKVGSVSHENIVESAILYYENHPEEYVGEKFYFKYATPHDIYKAVHSIKSNAVGEDQIPGKFIKLCLNEIIVVLEHIVNFCLQSSVFPTIWKAANILPIPKNSNPEQCKDLRPVSILCFVAKVLEKIAHGQITEFLSVTNQLNHLQSGYRKKHSTTTALLKVCDDIRKTIDQRKLMMCVLLDFSKAFDRVHHGLLLTKLRKMGFSISVIRWLYAYLSDRKQRVKSCEDFISEWMYLETGVPQGSVLGPLLFLLYVNDISDVFHGCSYHLYADDLIIYMSFCISTYSKTVSNMNRYLSHLVDYNTCHNFSLSTDKTQPIIFGSANYINVMQGLEIPEISIDGVSIPFCKTVKYLGVILDNTLNWSPYCVSTINKVFQTMAIVRRNFCYLPTDVRKKIVECLLFPIFDYALPVLTDLSSALCSKLQVAQNACIRFITNVPKWEHITPSYSQLQYLKILERRTLALAVIVWKVIKFKNPKYLFEFFSDVQSSNVRHGRSSVQRLVIPQHRTTTFTNSFTVTSCRLWNNYHIFNYISCLTPVTLKRDISLRLLELCV
ncbi:hypothetical protein ONE63_010800 [Megalurothrips usitatus]|uniref:Reverse transcriptase domain-containing protein n=1 Tax=Megalurothrips usitatus TaxID=439358 RepID=A0AAV7XG27_9NEOP|nr:hypothetical protein ONE63_010800 [Megalurothrips usitatus]